MTNEEMRMSAMQLKKDYGVSYQAQARQIGINYDAYTHAVRGDRNFPKKYAEKIQSYLGTTLDYFAGIGCPLDSAIE